MQPNSPEPLDTLPLRGWADAALWAAGALILLAAALLSCRLALQLQLWHSTTLRALAIAVFVLVPFVVAYASRRGGLPKALLYIPLILAIPSLARDFRVYEVLGCWVRDPAGHALGLFPILSLALGRYTIIPPIALGALAGWALRRWRGSL